MFLEARNVHHIMLREQKGKEREIWKLRGISNKGGKIWKVRGISNKRLDVYRWWVNRKRTSLTSEWANSHHGLPWDPGSSSRSEDRVMWWWAADHRAAHHVPEWTLGWTCLETIARRRCALLASCEDIMVGMWVLRGVGTGAKHTPTLFISTFRTNLSGNIFESFVSNFGRNSGTVWEVSMWVEKEEIPI